MQTTQGNMLLSLKNAKILIICDRFFAVAPIEIDTAQGLHAMPAAADLGEKGESLRILEESLADLLRQRDAHHEVERLLQA